MATTDGGMHWSKLSPDLGYPADVTPPPDSVRGRGAAGSPIGGAIQSMALSTVKRGVIWVGTGNGLIKVTTDEGKTWADVTIPGLPNPTRADVRRSTPPHSKPPPPTPPRALPAPAATSRIWFGRGASG